MEYETIGYRSCSESRTDYMLPVSPRLSVGNGNILRRAPIVRGSGPSVEYEKLLSEILR